jgi:hypothetical protein
MIDEPPKLIARSVGGALGIVGVPLLAAAVLALLLTAAPAVYALAAAALLILTLVAYRFPVVALSALVIAALGPMLFQMTTADQSPAGIYLVFDKVSIPDIILVTMTLACGVRVLVVFSQALLPRRGAALTLAFGAVIAWMAVSALRNVNTYGLHTAGQIRYSYLILIVPAYAAVFLRSSAQRRRFFLIFVSFSVGAALLAFPIVGTMKGWGIGPGSRFFPAPTSLGLVFGWLALLIACERDLVAFPTWLARVLGFPVVAIAIVDSHRSAWIAVFALLVFLLFVGRHTLAQRIRILAAGTAIAAVLIVAATAAGLGFWGFVTSRARAIVDPASDPTSAWRLAIWSSNLAQWRHHMLGGVGFGAYYAGSAEAGLAMTLQPHSLWVQTLVSMGAVGLAMLAALFVVVGATLWEALKSQRRRGGASLDALMVEFGLGILVASLAYLTVYSFDYYACIWVGLGLAAALRATATSPARGECA